MSCQVQKSQCPWGHLHLPSQPQEAGPGVPTRYLPMPCTAGRAHCIKLQSPVPRGPAVQPGLLPSWLLPRKMAIYPYQHLQHGTLEASEGQLLEADDPRIPSRLQAGICQEGKAPQDRSVRLLRMSPHAGALGPWDPSQLRSQASGFLPAPEPSDPLPRAR